MERIKFVELERAEGKARELLEMARKKGKVSRMLLGLAQSPAVLETYLDASGILGSRGLLSKALTEQIAVVVAGADECDYCASAHTSLGEGLGVRAEELKRNLKGESTDPRTQAALIFARHIVEKRGRISDASLSAVRNAGFSDGEIVEIVANTCLNIFTNYFNHIAGTEVDFPRVDTRAVSEDIAGYP